MVEVPNDVLRRIESEGKFTRPTGEVVPLSHSGGVAWELAEALYRTVKSRKPAKALEIGLANGFSALSILQAMEDNKSGSLISVDPFETAWSKGTGVQHIAQAGLAGRHQLKEEFDYLTLPAMVGAGEKFEFIYIDGNHDYDYVMLDFFYCDMLARDGGVIAFNDCGWRTVHQALKFVRSTNRYREIDVGLKPNYRARNPVFSLIRRATGRSSSDRYFEKISSAPVPG